MIVSSLEQVQRQVAMTPALQKAFDFLRAWGRQPFPDGRVAIDGNLIYAMVQSYSTQSGEPEFEFHRKYLDIQFMAAGEEIIGWAFADRMVVSVPYDEAKDICLGRVPPADVTAVRLSAGQAAVLFPSDAHAPGRAVGAPAPVRKIVVKIAV